MTEHSAAIFVFFFLAEYASIVLICIFSSILFLGGYLTFFSISYLINIIYFLGFELDFIETNVNIFIILFEGLIYSLTLGLKSSFLIFVFI
jgi:NADH-ubiquinone oxidoreductase chain 1